MSRSTRNTFVLSALLIGGILGAAIADTATADTFFTWVAKNGEIAYTNIKERIPAMHRDEAVEIDFEALVDRRTEMIITAKEQRDRLNQRLDYLREKNKVEPEPVETPIVIITVEETRRRVRARGPGK